MPKELQLSDFIYESRALSANAFFDSIELPAIKTKRAAVLAAALRIHQGILSQGQKIKKKIRSLVLFGL